MKEISRRAALARIGLGVVAIPAATLTACGTRDAGAGAARTPGTTAPPTPLGSTASTSSAATRVVIRSADLLVASAASLSDDVVAQVRRAAGVASVLPLTLGRVSVQGQLLTLASVDPATYRDFTPVAAAEDQAIWDRVAAGQLAVDPSLRQRLPGDGEIRLGAAADAPSAQIGAWAPQVAGAVHLVGDDQWAGRLAMPRNNALLISTGMTAPDRVVGAVRHAVGSGASVQRLDVVAREGLDPHAVQTAYVVGTVADAVGHYTYKVASLSAHGDVVTPDPDWVREHIVTDAVPIIGPVTGNRLFFPQLHAVFGEIVDRGLSSAIIKSEYGGAYFPRFIAGTHVLSNHAFGLAIDLNVAQNERGTPGQMNRTVVEIFNRWGFTWGGVWHYTDPMHFEINRLMSPGSPT